MNDLYALADQWSRLLWSMSWQVAVLVGLIWIVSLCCRRSSANFRYWLWCIVLIRLCLPMSLALPFGIGGDLRRVAEASAWYVVFEPDTAPMMASPADESLPNAAPLDIPEAREGIGSHTQPAHMWNRELHVKIALVWLLVTGAIAALVLFRCIYLRRVMKACQPITTPALASALDRLRVRLGIRRPIRVLCFPASLATRGPAVVGILRPTIMLPPQMAEQWSTEELEPVLLHELAHVKRWDLLVNLVQIVVQAVYFFHPLVWYANARIRRERELVCDDLAVVHSGGRPKRYSRSIVRVLEEIAKDGPLLGVVGLGMTEQRHSLARRIVRMMNKNYRLHEPVGWFSAAMLALVAALGIAVASEPVTGNAVTVSATQEPDIQNPAAPSPGLVPHDKMSFDELKAVYAQQVAGLAPEIRKCREESPLCKALQRAMEDVSTIVVRGEKARLQLVQIYASGRWDPKSLGPEFKVDPRDGDIIGHPLIDKVVGSLFWKAFLEAQKVAAPDSEDALGLARLMQRTKQATPLEDPANYKNPYEEGSLPAISLDRAIGEAVGMVTGLLAKICGPLPAPLDEKLRAANQMYDALKAKASLEKRERDLPEKLMEPLDVSYERMQEAVRAQSLLRAE